MKKTYTKINDIYIFVIPLTVTIVIHFLLIYGANQIDTTPNYDESYLTYLINKTNVEKPKDNMSDSEKEEFIKLLDEKVNEFLDGISAIQKKSWRELSYFVIFIIALYNSITQSFLVYSYNNKNQIQITILELNNINKNKRTPKTPIPNKLLDEYEEYKINVYRQIISIIKMELLIYTAGYAFIAQFTIQFIA